MAERTVVTKVQNAVLYSDGAIRIDNVRLSYPHLAAPFASEGDEGQTKLSYSVEGMLPKDTHRAAKDLVKKVIEDLLAENKAKVPTANWFLKDGDKLAEEDEKKEQCAGNFIVKASEKRRPTVRNRKGEVLTPEEAEQLVYGGCWGNILLRPWYFNGKAKNGKTYPKRILSNLIAVQFVRDDEAFGEGRISDDGVFDSVGGDDNNDGFDDDNNDL